jgi:hypothetical protein
MQTAADVFIAEQRRLAVLGGRVVEACLAVLVRGFIEEMLKPQVPFRVRRAQRLHRLRLPQHGPESSKVRKEEEEENISISLLSLKKKKTWLLRSRVAQSTREQSEACNQQTENGRGRYMGLKLP